MLAVVVLLAIAGWVLSVPGRAATAVIAPARPRARWRPPWRRAPRVAGSEVARVLVEVAARLRAGAATADAWSRALPSPRPGWAVPVLEAVNSGGVEGAPGRAGLDPGARGPTVQRPRRGLDWHWPGRRREAAASDVAAAVAACRLATRTGAPLAAVVDVVVAGIAEVAEAQALRRTALAGPRATARLLAWLPAGGIALGTALGADPLGVLLGGGLGGACLVGGGALFYVGHRWVHALVAQAERAGR